MAPRDMKILNSKRMVKRWVMPGILVFFTLMLILCVLWWRLGGGSGDAATKITIKDLKVAADIRPALSVTTAVPVSADWLETFSANGSIAAWQEATIGAELNGLQLVEVRVDVGAEVRAGQILAVFSSLTVKADVAQASAAVAEAGAALAEAKANADRARKAQGPGVISAQQISEYLNAERTAAARLEAARAQLLNQQTRLKQTMVAAPDDGVISARSVTIGTVPAVGQELFRLIRAGRLEWRAEVTSEQLRLIRIGQAVSITGPGDIRARGLVRMPAPTVDPQTRMGLVYVDVPANSGLKAGMFARGAFELGRKRAMTLPQSAVVRRDGFSYVYRLAPGNTVHQTKVQTGRCQKEAMEILDGLEPDVRVVATGAAFLVDGDTVRVVDPLGDQSGSPQ
ncbi:MAG: efflux RND transporter periplasmic adaptor subunit [Desulfocapsaceae bacterium]|nr:efflux RND transporter periplasmic adaptor subunit [Desulfocapsaceae bacterium]